MPKDVSKKLHKFDKSNKQQKDLHQFQLSMIANMDKTPTGADMPSGTTIDQKNMHSV